MPYARLKAVVLFSLLSGAVFVIATRFNLSTDLELFLPGAETRFDQLLRYQLSSSASANIILLSFSGQSEQELARTSRDMVAQLKRTGLFSKVSNNISELGAEALAFLEQHRYLLTHGDLRQKFSEPGFRDALARRLEGLASTTASIEKKYLRQDPSGEVLSLLQEWQGKLSRHKRPLELHGVWFSDDRSRALILLEIKADITEIENQVVAVTAIRTIGDQVSTDGISVTMTGPAVFAVESAEDIRADVRDLTLLAVVVISLFLFSVYRSMRMIVLVALPLAAGVLLATAVILLVNGQIHGITLVFGVTLAGVAVDYPIHMLTGIRQQDLRDNIRLNSVWRTLRLGVLSTIIAYAAFLLSDFDGLQQLGWFTIIGLGSAALFSRWLLPYLAWHQQDSVAAPGRFHRGLTYLGQRAPRGLFLVAATLIVSVLALMLTERPVLHLNVDSLSPISDSRRAEDKMLRQDIGFWYGGSMVLVVAENQQAVLRESEMIAPLLEELVARNELISFDMAAHFLPSVARQQDNLAVLQDTATIKANLNAALADFPFRPHVFDPFGDDLERLAELQPLTSESLSQSLIGNRLDSLLFPFAGGAAGVILLHGVRDHQTIETLVNKHESLYYMHLKSASTDLVARSVARVSRVMMACIIAIYLVLAWAFRSFYRPLKIMIPAFAAATGTAAILVFSGNPLSIFHLISLLLVVGLGLDYALFFNRLPGNESEWNTTFRALWVCGITTILVFGVLALSRTPPLQAFGTTVSMGAFMCMIFAAMWAAAPARDASPA